MRAFLLLVTCSALWAAGWQVAALAFISCYLGLFLANAAFDKVESKTRAEMAELAREREATLERIRKLQAENRRDSETVKKLEHAAKMRRLFGSGGQRPRC